MCQGTSFFRVLEEQKNNTIEKNTDSICNMEDGIVRL